MCQFRVYTLFFLLAILNFQCKTTDKERVTQKSLATVTTTQATAWDQFSITIQGNVSSPGDDVIIERGFVYGSSMSVNIDSFKVTVPSGVGPFTLKIEGLREKTLYYFKAYAKTSRGIAYGVPIGVSTTYGLLPEVELNRLEITRSAEDALNALGRVTSFGSTPEIVRGFIVSTRIDAQLSDGYVIYTTDPSIVNKAEGYFSTFLIKNILEDNTTYYVRAFSINKAGIAFSAVALVTTPGPGSVINERFIFRNNNLLLAAKVISSGSLPIIEQGVLLVLDGDVSDANFKFPLDPKIIKLQNINIHKDTFSVSLPGSKLTIGNKYNFRAYSLNARGYNYAPISEFRYLPIGAEFQNGLIYFVDHAQSANDTKAWIVGKQDLAATSDYGCLGDTIKNKTLTTRGESNKNTNNILLSCSSLNIAARKCRELSVISVPVNSNKWDLPSRDDLQLIYDTLASKGLGNFTLGSTSNYWSSSEVKETTAYAVNYGILKRSSTNNRKDELLKVRAIRAVK